MAPRSSSNRTTASPVASSTTAASEPPSADTRRGWTWRFAARAWLVAEDNWGVTASGRVAGRCRSASRSAPRAGSSGAGVDCRHRRPDRGPRRDRAGHGRGRCRRREARSASPGRYGTGAGSTRRDEWSARTGGPMMATAVEAAAGRWRPARPPSSPNGGRSPGARQAWPIRDPDACRRVRPASASADPEYLAGTQRIAPTRRVAGRSPPPSSAGSGPRPGASAPPAISRSRPGCSRSRELEPRWFAFGLLDRLLPEDPERAWQLLRRAAREAGDWITVDSLAHPVGTRHPPRAVPLGRARAARLLAVALGAPARRLHGRHAAVRGPSAGPGPEIAGHGLALIDELIGDDQPDVQKALSWALRSLARSTRPRSSRSSSARPSWPWPTDDGHRAWVLRDVLAKLPPDDAAAIRDRLEGIRRRAGAPSTSRAAATAARSAGPGCPAGRPPRPPPRPPLDPGEARP